MFDVLHVCIVVLSRPRKGAWIEILERYLVSLVDGSPPQGGVD